MSTSRSDLAARRAVLDRIGSFEREKAVLYAREARARTEMARLWGTDQDVCVELAGTARIGQDKAAGQLQRDERLVTYFPIALGLLELGVMRVGTVEIVLAVTKNASPQVQQQLDARLSERLCEMDAVDVRRLVAATLLEVESELEQDAQRERHDKARANRGVWAFPVEDGMARIGAELDQVTARRWCLDFEELVRAQKVLDDRDGITRTTAQRRADVFALLPSRVLGLADAASRGRLAALMEQVALMREHAADEDLPSDQTPDATLDEASEDEEATGDVAAHNEPALYDEHMLDEPLCDAVPADEASGDQATCDHQATCDDLRDDAPEAVDPGPVPVPRLAGDDLTPAPALVDCALERDRVVQELLRLPVRNPATLYLHTAMTTVLDLDQRSGWLEGIGPVPALQARMLLATANLRRVAVDETTGVPLGVDPLTGVSPPWAGEYDPPPRHRRHERQQARRSRLASSRAPDQLVPDQLVPAEGTPASPPGLGTSVTGVPAPGTDVRRSVAIDTAEGDGRSPAQVLRDRLLRMLGTPMYLTDRAEPRHDPSTALRALARLRDQGCDGPGCARGVAQSELDHEVPYGEGGQTAIWNLKHRSPRCHHCKHDGWTVEHDHHTGISTWTSPTGCVFVRLSPWQPPTPLPEDLVLPEPRLIEPRDVVPDWDTDRPLWRDSEPPAAREPRRGRTTDDVDEHGKPLPPPPRRAPSTWHDDGPPPF